LKLTTKGIFIFVLLITYINSSIVIKLGSYSNKDNINRELLKLDKSIRNNNNIIFEDNLYRAYSKEFNSEKDAINKLQLYRRVFTDAYIMHPTKNHYRHKQKDIIVKVTQSKIINKTEVKKTEDIVNKMNIKHSSKIIKPINIDDNNNISLTNLLVGRTLYFAPNKIKSKSQKMLIEVSFDNEGIVNYSPLIGKFPPLSMRYYIKGKRLYITRSTPNAYQFIKLEEIFFEYYLLSKYSMGKKISTLRYYTNQDNAKAYLNSFRF